LILEPILKEQLCTISQVQQIDTWVKPRGKSELL